MSADSVPRALIAWLALGLVVILAPLHASTAAGGEQPISGSASLDPPASPFEALPAISATQIRGLCSAPAAGGLPSIPWTERSDWINVREDVEPGAAGDGKADDTAAIQAALDLIGERPGDPKVVYLPPGTYRITETLVVRDRPAGMLVGHGRDTRILWDGRPGGRMLWSNGFPRSTYRGIVWDGAGKAGVGIDHDSKSRYETRVMHEHMEFRGFTIAGIRVGHDQKLASAEMLFKDLRFVENATGALFQSWNDYNNVFDGCHFIGNGYGVRAERGNVSVRNSRFEASARSDLYLSTHSHSIRRVVSVGSRAFVRTVRGPAANSLVKLQDVLVAGWRDPRGAIVTELRGPLLILDTAFVDGPGAAAPIRLANPVHMKQIAILGNVSSTTEDLIEPGPKSDVLEVGVPPAARTVTIDRQFLREVSRQPTAILDVKEDCGARGDGSRDDASSIQSCLDRAHDRDDLAVVYFPSGVYRVEQTLRARAGARYRIEGTGWHSRIVRTRPAGGAVLHVEDPQGLSIERLTLGGPPGTVTLLQTGTRPGSVRYHNLFGHTGEDVPDVRMVLDGLPAGTVVVADHLDGRLLVRDSSPALILIGFLVSRQLQVEGTTPQTGFLGVLSRVSARQDFPLVVRDNQSLVMTDWYNEQSRHLAWLGGGGTATGRVVLDHSQAANYDDVTTVADGYQGLLVHSGGMFGRAAETKGRSLDIRAGDHLEVVLLANAYWGEPPRLGPAGDAIVFGNSVNRRGRGRDTEAVVTNEPAGPYTKLPAAVIGAWRWLGAYDSALNHCAGPLMVD